MTHYFKHMDRFAVRLANAVIRWRWLVLMVDTDSQEWFFNLEAERRIGEHFVAEARLRIFNGDQQLNQLYAFDRDDYFQLSLSRFF